MEVITRGILGKATRLHTPSPKLDDAARFDRIEFGGGSLIIDDEEQISPRQNLVLCLGVVGLSANQSGQKLYRSKYSVLAERRKLFAEFGCASMGGAIGHCFRNRILKIETPLDLPNFRLNEQQRYVLEQTELGKNQMEIAEDLSLTYNALRHRMRSVNGPLGSPSIEATLTASYMSGAMALEIEHSTDGVNMATSEIESGPGKT